MRERGFHGKMSPLLGRACVSLVPNATVKRRDILALRGHFLAGLQPDADAARGLLMHERLQGFLQQFFSRSAVQRHTRDASSA